MASHSSSTPSPRVRRAMQDVERYYVDMEQLLERSGAVIADLLGAEAAYVTPGAAAALALGAAACLAGADPDKIGRLPDTTGMPGTVLIQAGHRYHYERAATVPGGRLVEVGEKSGTTADQLRSALGQDVAAVMFPAHLDGKPGTLLLADVIAIAHTLLAGLNAVNHHASLDSHGHVVIAVDAADSITLTSVHHVSDLGANDFVFV